MTTHEGSSIEGSTSTLYGEPTSGSIANASSSIAQPSAKTPCWAPVGALGEESAVLGTTAPDGCSMCNR